MTLRRTCLAPTICLTADTAHTYIAMKPEPADLSKIEVWIRKADGSVLHEKNAKAKGPKKLRKGRWKGGDAKQACNTWLLRYPAHDYDAGHIGFRWDDALHELPPGLYMAEIQIDCVPCHRFGIEVPHCEGAQFGTGQAKALSVDEVTTSV